MFGWISWSPAMRAGDTCGTVAFPALEWITNIGDITYRLR